MPIIIVLIWSALLLVSLYLIREMYKVHNKYTVKKPQNLRQYKPRAKVSKATVNNPSYAGLWHKLLTLVQFDVPAAERLLATNRRKHPDKSEKWCIEKAIYDIERDRH